VADEAKDKFNQLEDIVVNPGQPASPPASKRLVTGDCILSLEVHALRAHRHTGSRGQLTSCALGADASLKSTLSSQCSQGRSGQRFDFAVALGSQSVHQQIRSGGLQWVEILAYYATLTQSWWYLVYN
jgi:hypothetical protein